MSSLFTAPLRRRRAILVVAVAVAVGYPVLRGFASTRDAPLTEALYYGLMVGLLGSVVLVIATVPQGKPAALVARPDLPAFEASPGLDDVGLALILIFTAGGQAGSLVTPGRQLDVGVVDVVLRVLFAAVALIHLVGAWQGLGVRLRPDGLWWRTPARSVRVPWAALAPDGPPRPGLKANTLKLSYARPELVRRRGPGWRLDRFPVGRIHPWFLSDVIRHYVAHPEHRAAIGTDAEYHHLLGALGVKPATAAPGPTVP